MAVVVHVFDSDARYNQYLSYLEQEALSGSIIRYMIKGWKHWLVGTDLPAKILAAGQPKTGFAGTGNSEQFIQDFLDTATLPSLWTLKNKGAMFVLAGLAGQVVSGEVQDVLNKMAGLTDEEINCITVFVNSQVGAGNWGTKGAAYADSKIDYFSALNLFTEANALISWRNTFTGVNTAAVHTSGEGYVFNGTTAWIDTNFTPSAGITYQLDDALMGIYSQYINNNQCLIGAGNTTFTQLFKINATQINAAINAGSGGAFTPITFNESLFVIARVGATETHAYRQGVLVNSPNITSTVLNTGNIAVAARLAAGVPDRFGDMGASSIVFGAAIGFDHLSFYNDLVTLNNCLTQAAVIASFPGVLTDKETADLKIFLNAELSNGNFQKLDSLVLMNLSDPLNAVWDLVRRVAITPVNAPVHDSNFGFIYDGINQYHDTGFNPSTDGKNYKQNDAHFGVFVVSAPTVASVAVAGSQPTGGSPKALMYQRTTTQIDIGINSATDNVQRSPLGAFNDNELTGSVRTSSVGTSLAVNGVVAAASAIVSNGLPAFPIFLGCLNNNGTPALFASTTLSCYMAGGAVGFLQDQFYDNLKQFLNLQRIEGIVDSFPNALLAEEETGIRNYLRDELANGNFDLLDSLIFMNLLDATNSLWDVVRRTTATNNGAIHTSGTGYFIDTANNINCNLDLDNSLQDNIQVSAFVASNVDISNFVKLFSGTAIRTSLLQQPNNSRLVAYINTGSLNAAPLAVNTFQGGKLYGITRLTATEVHVLVDGVQVEANPLGATSSLPSDDMILAADMSITLSSFSAGRGVGYNHLSSYTNLVALNGILEAEGVIASFPNALAAGEADKIRAFVLDEYANGNWQLMDSFADFALTDPVNALWDWKRRVGMTNGGIHTAEVGITFTNIENLDTLADPDTNLVQYSQDNGMAGAFCVSNDDQAADDSYLVRGDGLWQLLQQPTSSSRLRIRMNGNGNGVDARHTFFQDNTLYISTRSDSTTQSLFIDGIGNTLATTSTGLPIVSFKVADLGFAGTVAAFIAGAAIGINQTELNTHIRTLLGV